MGSLGDATVFSTLSTSSGQWHIKIVERDRYKDAFTSHHGFGWFNRMPFRLKYAPTTVQGATGMILYSLRWQVTLVYLNDILVFSKSVEDHIEEVRRVLRLPSEAGDTLKLKKCELFAETIYYLDHAIRPGRPELALHTTDAVKKIQHCTTQSELRSYLALCILFRRFGSNLARLVASLIKKLRIHRLEQLGALHEKNGGAVVSFKGALIVPPVLNILRAEEQYTLDTDTCDKQIPLVL